ncbi:MAG: DUF188 domain-containing protein [Planctomycetota bacterium]
MKIFVDADACPAKNEILEVCRRHKIAPIFVANAEIPAIAASADAQMQVVSANFDAADHWIIQQAQPGDLIITADLLLAQQAARKKVDAINFSGGALTDEIIHDLVARREIQQFLREMNLPSHKPTPYGKANRSRFKATLHQWLDTQRNLHPSANRRK